LFFELKKFGAWAKARAFFMPAGMLPLSRHTFVSLAKFQALLDLTIFLTKTHHNIHEYWRTQRN
jgi:hypothetical protein